MESLPRVNTNNICGSHPLHQVTHCVANSYKVHQALFLFHKFVVITSSDLPALNVLETVSRIICSITFARMGVKLTRHSSLDPPSCPS